MISDDILLQQFIFGTIALFITYTTGKLIASFFKIEGNFFFRLFVTYIIGITSIVIVYSIIKAHGRTVNILLIPIIGYLIYNYQSSLISEPKYNKKELFRELAWSIVPFFFIFLYQSWFFFDFNNGQIKPLFGDFYWYGVFSNSLKLWGVENYVPSMNHFFPITRNALMPYHYPELWLSALFSGIFKTSTLLSYYFIVYPIVSVTFIIGILSLITEKIKNKLLLTTLGFVLFFLSGINVPFFKSLIQDDVWSIASLGQKIAFVYPFLLLGLMMLSNKKNYKISLLFLSAIPVLSVTFLPSVSGGVYLFLFFLIIKQRGRFEKTDVLILFFNSFVLLVYVLFYSIFKSKTGSEYVGSIFETGVFSSLKQGITVSSIKATISNIIVYSIPTILYHIAIKISLFLLFFILFVRRIIAKPTLLFFILCVSFCGATASTLANVLHDSEQFNGIVNALFIILCLMMFVENLPENITQKSRIIISSIAVILVAWFNIPSAMDERSKTSSIDMNFIENVSKSIDSDKTIILSFFNKNDIAKYPFFNFWNAENSITAINQYSNKTVFFAIGNPEDYIWKPQSEQYDKSCYNIITPIVQWKRMHPRGTLQEFVDEYKIRYFYFKNGAEIPEFILKRKDTMFYSSASNDIFIKIR